MAAPLSLDLRTRIIDTFQKGDESPKAVAARFCISRASVYRLIELHRDTGSVAPKPHGGGVELLVRPEDEPLLAAWIEENPSVTQAEMARRFTEATGRSVCQQTIGRALKRIDQTRKKSPHTPRSATA